jgi:DNA-binding response OmpR family regulator
VLVQLERALKCDLYEARVVSGIRDILRSATVNEAVAIVADLGTHQSHLLKATKSVRKVTAKPLLVILGQEHANIATAALEAGANDIVFTPVSPRQFLIRLRSAIRRHERLTYHSECRIS